MIALNTYTLIGNPSYSLETWLSSLSSLIFYLTVIALHYSDQMNFCPFGSSHEQPYRRLQKISTRQFLRHILKDQLEKKRKLVKKKIQFTIRHDFKLSCQSAVAPVSWFSLTSLYHLSTLCQVHSVHLFWSLSLHKNPTSQRSDVGNSCKVFSAFFFFLGWGRLKTSLARFVSLSPPSLLPSHHLVFSPFLG